MAGNVRVLLRNLRLRAEGRPNPIDAMEDLKTKLAQEQKRRAEAELEVTTLQRRLNAFEKPRDAQGRYTRTRGAATCATSNQQQKDWQKAT
ncbi:hypothetical protein FOH24_07690 [Acetobacter tropicalis]|uniref:Uncharacterized protein n=1 Tax=Acetobacter tropicalis TaxID=104102 RepID=A0A094YIR3_9PROT|nr:hypothetical protein [Acetobacter tropicalis]KAA8384038.1 hypothetical protein FOH22_15345 [Acetobacter tropicalis]KAA8391253.1 hypothetical protein FOH24_07690 [Acetobacter tropicalis]KGB21925.1 hypothetical protein AtDm6_2691 [Acetobacter tropicalis]MDO8173233.1 hypothetical protein [Acetobacter tropicalis]